ncbi:Crp/Fnr family transcriptional regulator [Candidatus Curtissbacteria bacterium]|nr:Crp/Fnr family transcriptional regulator [Candidatus Curtissbacteria bacterium]
MSRGLHELDSFFSESKPLRYKKGEVIFRAGDQPPGIYYLAAGYVRVYSFSKSGEELTLIIFRPGDIFPVSWAVNSAPSGYFVEAMTPSELWRVSREEFLEYVHDKPKILFELIRRMMERFLGLMHRMEHLAFGNARSKVASILLICAERFSKRVGKVTVIDVPLTHNDIANLVGLTRETVSIEMKKLEKKNLISYRGKLLVVKDTRELVRESQIDRVD